jgi:hypothetical protein
MRYEARMTAFDMLDQVHVALVVFATDDYPGAPTVRVVQSSTTVQGTGESDPYQWARDALVACLEDL